MNQALAEKLFVKLNGRSPAQSERVWINIVAEFLEKELPPPEEKEAQESIGNELENLTP